MEAYLVRRLLMLAALLIVRAGGRRLPRSRTSPASGRRSSTRTSRIACPGLGPADFAGLPLTDGARQWALSWDASRVSVLEHQCQVHVLPYILSGPTRLRISAQRDGNTERIVAFQQYIGLWGQQRTIWVDGRPHPPEIAPHSWMGFSTGAWEGNTLVVRTTHIKQGWVRRNGVPQSDEVATTERFTRHGDMLTYVIHIKDPVYLTEPLVRSRNFVRMSGLGEGNWIAATPCEPAEETTAPPHAVPHYLPGENPFVAEAEKTERDSRRGADGRRRDALSRIPPEAGGAAEGSSSKS